MSKIILNGIEYSNGITYEELQPVIYSTEEREIGCWTDGKPLYQKTISFGALPNSTSKSVAHGISDLDKIVDFSALAKRPEPFNIIPLPSSHYQSTSAQQEISFNATNITIRNGNNASAYTDVYVTLQYTKTTDTAGSGSWTPSGANAVHYSTNEQVIGTWIDGKPRYEITLSGSGSYSVGSELVVPLPTNADKVVIMGGYVDIGTDWLPVNLTLGVGTGTTNGVYCYPNKSTGIHIYSSAWTFSEYNVTVQYCKTTD